MLAAAVRRTAPALLRTGAAAPLPALPPTAWAAAAAANLHSAPAASPRALPPAAGALPPAAALLLPRGSPALLPGAAFARRGFAAKGGPPEDDFKPVLHGQPQDVKAYITRDITSNKVMLYMKGNPEQPMCGFSKRAVDILRFYQFGSRDVLADPDLREGIKAFSNWPTIPQLYIGGEFVGGSDILMSMHQGGELAPLFQSAGADFKQPPAE